MSVSIVKNYYTKKYVELLVYIFVSPLISRDPVMSNTSVSSADSAAMNIIEKRAATSLASLYALRMLGLFMVLPIMMHEGATLEGATVSLLGLAMGIYGLTQALLQLPPATLSDRFGRKPLFTGGLIVFPIATVVAATADSIWAMLSGRPLPGAVAIAVQLWRF